MTNREIIDKPINMINYTQLSNELLRDKSLTWAAQGILTHLHSLHPDSNITLEYLASIRPNGRDATRRALAELEQTGYLTRTRIKGEKGKFEHTIWAIRWLPKDCPTSDIPSMESPITEKPDTVLPTSAKQPHINTIQNNKIKKIQTTTHRRASNSAEEQVLILPSLLSTSEYSAALKIVSNIPLVGAQSLLDELEDVLERKANTSAPLAWLAGIKKVYERGEYNPVGALRIANKRNHIHPTSSSPGPCIVPSCNEPRPLTPSSAKAGEQAIAKLRKRLQQSGIGNAPNGVKPSKAHIVET